jgi:hypothetical protein
MFDGGFHTAASLMALTAALVLSHNANSLTPMLTCPVTLPRIHCPGVTVSIAPLHSPLGTVPRFFIHMAHLTREEVLKAGEVAPDYREVSTISGHAMNFVVTCLQMARSLH